MLIIFYTNKQGKLKHVTFSGQSTDQYMIKGNCIQWYELDGVRVSFDIAFRIINGVM